MFDSVLSILKKKTIYDRIIKNERKFIVMSVLEVQNLKFNYGDKELFSGLDVRIFDGEHVGIVGANGVGKTTFMNLISEKLTPDEGTIIWDNTKSFSYLDQHLIVNDEITIQEYLYSVYNDLFKKEEEMNQLY